MTIPEAKKRLIDVCELHLGYVEGADNWNRYAEDIGLQRWYGWKPQNQPWCDIWGDSMFLEAFGLDLAAKLTYQPVGSGTALCRASADCYKQNGAWFNYPEEGDEIFFYYDGAINHVGIVTFVANAVVYTIEGNTSDRVARRAYDLGSELIAGYGRPNWAVLEDADVPEPDPTEEPDPGPAVTGLPVLQRGDTGETVRALQFLLNGRGCSCGVYGADGDLGPATEAAILAFQRRNKLEDDGIVGPATWAKLLGL